MKFKAHKIKNVSKSVCTAEQKIACNYADLYEIFAEKINNSDLPEFVKCDAENDVIKMLMKSIKENGIADKYNVDIIIVAFRRGFRKWQKVRFSERFSYEKIGEIFDFPYEIV